MLTIGATKGFTLVEALVAIVIMIAGIGGSAALLLKSITQERDSGSRRTALRLANSMADQLRAVRRPDGRAVIAITGMMAAEACADQPVSCESERAAERLRDTWIAEAGSALPQGASAYVDAPDPLVPAYLVSIDWPAVGGGIERLRLPVTT